MAEDQGGTSDKTYTQAEIDAAISEAKSTGNKEGQSTAHAHWQSVGDKAIAQLSKENEGRLSQANETITQLRKAQLETMDPQERSAAMMQQVLDRMEGNGANNASDKSSPFTQTDASQGDKTSVQAQQVAELAQQRKQMGEGLATKFGIDASKLDWAEGKDGTAAMDTFMGSFAEALKAVGTEKPKDDPNKVDTSNQPGGDTFDLNTSDPKDLIRSGASRVRPNMGGGPNSSPWL